MKNPVEKVDPVLFAESLKKTDWEVQRFNAYPFFISGVATLSGFELAWGLKYMHFLCIAHIKNVEWHYDRADYERIGNIFWSKIETINDLKVLIDEYRSTYAEVVKNAEYVEADLASLSIDELKVLLKAQVQRVFSSAGIAHIIECASYVGEQKLSAEYGIDPSQVHPSEISFIQRAALYAQELCDSHRTDNEIVDDFNKKFAWVQSTYLGRNDMSIGAIRDLAHSKKESVVAVDGGVIDGEAKVFVGILSNIFSWQDERKFNILESIYRSQPVLDMVAVRLGISKDVIKFMLPEEVDRVTDTHFQKELVGRSKLFVDYAPNTLKRTSFVGTDAQKFIDSFIDVHTSGADLTLKGQTAFAGKVQGIVRICLSLESINTFKTGEILVASMTRPEYVSAMKKAAAFVTNEGGITCHAAIIARELKKPCVIGTKIATKVLKDGDLVEVDATNGTVRIVVK